MGFSIVALLIGRAPLLRYKQSMLGLLALCSPVYFYSFDSWHDTRDPQAVLTVDASTAGGRADPPECTQNW